MIQYEKDNKNTDFENIEKMKNSYQDYCSKINKQAGIAFILMILAHILFFSFMVSFSELDTVNRVGVTILTTFILMFTSAILIVDSPQYRKVFVAIDRKINPFHKEAIDNSTYFSNNETRLSILQEMDDILAEAKKYDFLTTDVDLINSKKAQYLLLSDNHADLWKESCDIIEILINIKEKIQTLKNNSIYRQYENQISKPAIFDKRGIL